MMYLAHTESLMAAVVDDEVFKQLSDLKLGLQVNCFSLLFHKLMAAVRFKAGTTDGFFLFCSIPQISSEFHIIFC